MRMRISAATLAGVILAALSTAVLAIDPPPEPAVARGAAVAHEVYGGYFVSNKFEPENKLIYLVIRDKERFDEVFGVAFVMGDRSHRLAPDALKSQMVVAVIKRGNALWKYEVEKTTAEKGTLYVQYKATAEPGGSATFACPMILSVPKDDYSSVVFIENERQVKRLAVASK